MRPPQSQFENAATPTNPKIRTSRMGSQDSQTARRREWWRRRESNPGPKVLRGGPYVRVRRF